MLWVKGELLTDVDSPGIDPTGQLERSAQPGLFDRREWFRRVWRHGGGLPLIGRAASEGALCWLFLHRAGRGSVSSLTNWYSFAFRPVFSGDPDAERRRAMLVAMAKRLRAARPRIASLTLSPVPDSDGSADLLLGAFSAAGWLTFAQEASVSWTTQVGGRSFAEYWEARPGSLRSTLKRKLAKADFETQIFTRFDADAWAAYEDVYRESWKPDEGLPEFLKELAIAEAIAGCLRLGFCRVDGAVVAAQFWTVENGVALIHKLAHRESATDLSPGTILSAAMFHHVIDEDRVHTIDFGTGDDGYKADWMDAWAPLMRIEAYNPASVAGLLGAAKTWLSRLVRRGTGR
jgi:hypothetical protein